MSTSPDLLEGMSPLSLRFLCPFGTVEDGFWIGEGPGLVTSSTDGWFGATANTWELVLCVP